MRKHLHDWFYYSFLWWFEKNLGGHIKFKLFGCNTTLFGFNAMHLAINVYTDKWGYVCYRPAHWFGRWWGWYLYTSPNATPWASTFAIGGGISKENKEGAIIRRRKYGHNFDDRILHPDIHPEVKQLYPQYFNENLNQ